MDPKVLVADVVAGLTESIKSGGVVRLMVGKRSLGYVANLVGWFIYAPITALEARNKHGQSQSKMDIPYSTQKGTS